jgi:hypothetical protein
MTERTESFEFLNPLVGKQATLSKASGRWHFLCTYTGVSMTPPRGIIPSKIILRTNINGTISEMPLPYCPGPNGVWEIGGQWTGEITVHFTSPSSNFVF